ncbi:associated molecule with the SH3 domain of STAM 1 [Rhynchospora pubera]|uniref:Associated molecule with the SH3 domain of STAM 1 n=1 Tax=Rhynchospora pubera TaxID=906938 RepID=A0AAV8DJA0_9POAL|nr:associated molecule with the SH3 domain of STAM 1 [Rhynchospora pubera]
MKEIDINACTRPVEVDQRISLPYYYRIADNLLRQAKIYREEKNIIDLYIILVRYSSLLCETIPSHRDYGTFKSTEKSLFRKKLLDVISELETLKPVVQQKVDTHNKAVKHQRETSASSSSSAYASTVSTPQNYQTYVGNIHGSSSKQSGTSNQVVPLDQFQKLSINLPYPKEETLSRHSILGPNGLRSNWTGPVTNIRVQYPSNAGLTQNEVSGLLSESYKQEGFKTDNLPQHPPGKSNYDLESVLSLDDGRWSSSPTAILQEMETTNHLNIRQPSPPPVRAEVQQVSSSIPPERVADPRPGPALSDSGRYQDLHVPVKLMECFLRVAEANTSKNLETCGILGGYLKNRIFYVSTLIIPKQKATSDSCTATNEEEIFEVQDKNSLFTLGWIHTHPTQTCFLSSIDLHNHYSYQVMLPEAIAIVMAPTDTERKHGIFHLTDPSGMSVMHDCQETGFHPHEEPLDGNPIYEHCSHVYMNPNVKFELIDLRNL